MVAVLVPSRPCSLLLPLCCLTCLLLCTCRGFTSVAQYLDSKTATAAGQAKLSLAAVLTWALMGAAMVLPLGGLSTTYSDSLAILTDGGLQMDNLLFLWVAVLAYFSVKVGAATAAAQQPL